MTLPQSVGEVLQDHVRLACESIDRMYLNVYVPQLQAVGGVVWYLRGHLGQRLASTATVAPKSEAFVAVIERFAKQQGSLVKFKSGQRKDALTQEYLRRFSQHRGGAVYRQGTGESAGDAHRAAASCRDGDMTYPWIVPSTAMVNHYYFYCVDEDFGPFFLKFYSYFPYNAKLCINGHEYAKCQLRKRGIRFRALDNGIGWCEDPKALQAICDGLREKKIEVLLRKWLAKLPHPFARDRRAGYRYALSVLQAEFSLTQVLDRPVVGRIFFEEVIRENLDLGRPGQVQLSFQE